MQSKGSMLPMKKDLQQFTVPEGHERLGFSNGKLSY
jgi:hypothetical protein